MLDDEIDSFEDKVHQTFSPDNNYNSHITKYVFSSISLLVDVVLNH